MTPTRSDLGVYRIGWLAGVAILALILGTGLVSRLGAQNGTGGTINACKHDRTGVLRIVDASSSCAGGWTALNWNVQGAPGAPGAPGPQGAQGPAGQAVTTGLFTATGQGEVILSSSNGWNEFPSLSRDISLAKDSLVLVSYQITMGGNNRHLVTRLAVDGEEQMTSRAIDGDTQYWSPANLWLGQLPVGDHNLKVEYRTPAGGSNNPAGSDWNSRVLNVLVFNPN